MILNQNAIERAVQVSKNLFIKNNKDNNALQAINGLNGPQTDVIIDKVAATIMQNAFIFDDFIKASSNAALLTKEGIVNLEEKMISMVTKNALIEISDELQNISEEIVKSKREYRPVNVVFDGWSNGKLRSSTSKHFDECLQSAFNSSIPDFALLISDPAAIDSDLSQDHHLNQEQVMEKVFDKLTSKNNPNFKNIDNAKNDFEFASNAILQNTRTGKKDKLEDDHDAKNADIKGYVIRATAKAMRTLAQPYENILTFEQTKTMLTTAQNMLMAYVLEDIGKQNVLHQDPEKIKGIIAETITANMLLMEKFLAVHVELTNSFENTLSVNANNKESNEKVTELISTVGNLTMTAGDLISDVPSVRGIHVPSGKKAEFGHISRGGDAGYVVGAGISLLSIPAEYAIAKLRGEKAPEMTKEKAWQSTVKTVGFGLAVSALCVPHIAVILTVTGAAIGAVTAAGSSAYHFYEKSKLKDLIDNIKKRLPDLQDNAQKALVDLEFLATLAHKINTEGHLLTKEEVYTFTTEFNKLKGRLDVTLHELQTEMKNLGEALFTLQNDFSTQSTVGATTSVVSGTTYLAGAAMNFVPVLNVAASALMIASDAISLTYTASTKLSAVSSNSATDAAAAAPSRNINTLFSHNASETNRTHDKQPESPKPSSGPK